jgi:small subunit ribosomal protein S6
LAVKRIYEAMFLFDPTAGSNWEHVEQEVGRLMERAEGELIRIKKWDERRLAYEIEGRRRGLYVLCFFRAPTNRIVDLERDVQLSEEILRVLCLRRDNYTEEMVNEIADKSQGYTPEPSYGYGDRGRGYGRDRFAESNGDRQSDDIEISDAD